MWELEGKKFVVLNNEPKYFHRSSFVSFLGKNKKNTQQNGFIGKDTECGEREKKKASGEDRFWCIKLWFSSNRSHSLKYICVSYGFNEACDPDNTFWWNA